MKPLKDYLLESNEVDEELVKAALSLATLNRMDPQELLTGILNMYDYIVDDDDIKMFFNEYPVREQPLWRNLYEMYNKKLFSILDIHVETKFFNSTNDDGDDTVRGNDTGAWLNESFPVFNELIKVTPEFRRNLRKFIKESRNTNLDLKPSDPEYIMAVEDEVNSTVLIFTINRKSGLLGRIFSAADRKWLERVLTKLVE